MNPDKLFFIADAHFGHANIIRYCNRPFADVAQMDEALIANWNAIVPSDATVYHLGDISFRSRAETFAILERLNGAICLVIGNHDGELRGKARERFQSVEKLQEIRIEEHPIVLCHYPLANWNRQHEGAWMLHGHSHGSTPRIAGRIDVGVDCFKYAPVSYRSLCERMD